MAMRNRFLFHPKDISTLAEPSNQLCLLDLPIEILWMIVASLPRKDRASFAFTAKIIAAISREMTFRQVKPSTETFLSTSAPHFDSLKDIETRLGNLIDYTYTIHQSSLSTDETNITTQLRLALSMRLLMEYMCNIVTYSPSLSLKLQKGYQVIESDDTGMVVYTNTYDYISHDDVSALQHTATRIQSAIALNLTGTALQLALNTNMAVLSDTLRSISNGLTPLNTAPASNSFIRFMNFFTCGIFQTFTPQENRLICLLLACTNAFARQLNELNENMCAPVRRIEPQRINRR